jgi:hypothetical protein
MTPERHDRLFPLTVSLLLIILTGLAVYAGLQLQNRLFLSGFDRFVIHVFMLLSCLLTLLWLLLLLADSFGIRLGRLYKPLKWLLFYVFYPLALLPVWVRLIRKPNLQESLLAFQNRLFLNNYRSGREPNILILLPHCLQFHDCRVRITRDFSDCEECGKCDIAELKRLGLQYNIKVGIANGGTLARKIVHDNHPDLIIAVACHRDLTDGVRESWQYPVYAILNERPYGPCYDTCVNVEWVGEIVNSLLGEHQTHENTKHTKGVL